MIPLFHAAGHIAYTCTKSAHEKPGDHWQMKIISCSQIQDISQYTAVITSGMGIFLTRLLKSIDAFVEDKWRNNIWMCSYINPGGNVDPCLTTLHTNL